MNRLINKLTKKEKKDIDKKEKKVSRVSTFLSNMDDNEEIKLTPFAKAINMHPHTLRDLLDSWQIIKDAGNIMIIRDVKGNISRVVKLADENKDLLFKKEIRDNLMNINNKIDELMKR